MNEPFKGTIGVWNPLKSITLSAILLIVYACGCSPEIRDDFKKAGDDLVKIREALRVETNETVVPRSKPRPKPEPPPTDPGRSLAQWQADFMACSERQQALLRSALEERIVMHKPGDPVAFQQKNGIIVRGTFGGCSNGCVWVSNDQSTDKLRILALPVEERLRVDRDYRESWIHLHCMAQIRAETGWPGRTNTCPDITTAETLAWDWSEPGAMFELGNRYLRGRGVPVDPGYAMLYFKVAAALNHGPSQYALGQMYLRGMGGQKRPDSAKRLIAKAASNGYRPAKQFVREHR
jgi:hypothetical protein